MKVEAKPPRADGSRIGIGPSTLEHLGWVDLCEQLERRLKTSLARAALERELARTWELRRWDAEPGDVGDAAREPADADEDAQPRVLVRCLDVERARSRFRELDALEQLLALEVELEPEEESGDDVEPRFLTALADVVDLDAVSQRAQHGASLSAGELMLVRLQLRAVARVIRLREHAAARQGGASRRGLDELGARVGRLERLSGLASALREAIGASGPDGEPWVLDGASRALADARQRARALRAELVHQAERMIRRQAVADCLQDRFWTERDGRVVLPVRTDAYARESGPVAGVIHSSSQGGATLFVEPRALMEGNNGLRTAQLEARAEELRVLAELSRRVGSYADILRANQRVLIELDGMQARLRVSQAIDGLTPRVHGVDRAPVNENDVRRGGAGDVKAIDEDLVDAPKQSPRDWLRLEGMRHPLMLLAGAEVVPNDIALEHGVSLIVSGPNAGGKTVALKTVGLCSLMAQAGLRVPTQSPADLPLFTHIVTDVGDDQSISANLSTFSAHIHHVLEAFAAAEDDPSGTLVLFDEIAVGTAPTQGAALAEAILLHLSRAGATVITTTHYDRLKLLARAHPGQFENAAVGFDIERMAPTFRLTQGVPGASSALAVARRLGVPAAVLESAEERIEKRALQVDVLLQEISAERDALTQTREQLEQERLELKLRTRRVEAREEALIKQAKSRKVRAYDETSAELRALKTELSGQRKELRKRGADEDALDEAARLASEARAQLAAAREPNEPVPGRPPEELEVGEQVLVATLGVTGEVVALKGKRKVVVQLEHARSTVARDDLRRLHDPTAGASRRPSSSSGSSGSS
ncbi:MAG: hypothetical protein KC468_13730, partial [Myxococcales bacterium]|nr:hypothetical protein [Myxococcales bacterium]